MSGISDLSGKFVDGNVIDRDFGDMKIDRNTVDNYSLRTGMSPLPVRLAMGLFYTTEEWEERREELLRMPLPGAGFGEKFRYRVFRIKKTIGKYI